MIRLELLDPAVQLSRLSQFDLFALVSVGVFLVFWILLIQAALECAEWWWS